MRLCPLCRATYTDRIDFCFSDGEVLVNDDARSKFAKVLGMSLDLGAAQEEFDRLKSDRPDS